MKLVAGLGNPGAQYAGTRHNIGFYVVDALAERLSMTTWNKKFKGHVNTGTLDTSRVVLLKPQTYMNLSGESLQAVAAFYRIPPPDMIVVHDDIDLKLGRIIVKVGGGHGGHNGLRSIMTHLGPDFVRVRIGVSRPSRGDASNHVLAGFADHEQEVIAEAIEKATQAVLTILREGAKAAQNLHNIRPKPPKKPKEKDADLPKDSKDGAEPEVSPVKPESIEAEEG